MQTDIAAGYKIPNISYGDSEAKTILIYGGSFAKVLQYIFKDCRVLPIPVGNSKNEGRKGKAKAGAKVCSIVPSIGSMARVFQLVYLNMLTGYAEIVPRT